MSSLIDDPPVAEDVPAYDGIVTSLQTIFRHEVDWATQDFFEVVFQAEELVGAVAWIEVDQEVRVARFDVEIGASGRRAEDIEARDLVATACGDDPEPLLLQHLVHGCLPVKIRDHAR